MKVEIKSVNFHKHNTKQEKLYKCYSLISSGLIITDLNPKIFTGRFNLDLK